MSQLRKLVIFGDDLAAEMCLSALSYHLPAEIKIVHLKTGGSTASNCFFGSVTSQSIYDFLLDIGVSEPEILLNTQTAFSLGTHYRNWGYEQRDWIQSYHKPLPLFDGIGFHHFLKRHQKKSSNKIPLDDYIMSVQAAKKNVFAHPPEDTNIPLATVEYGYHFSPDEWRNFFSARNSYSRAEVMEKEISKIYTDFPKITTIELNDGQKIEADLFIDCSADGLLISKTSNETVSNQDKLGGLASSSEAGTSASICRNLYGTDFGWHSETPLQNGHYNLTLFSSENRNEAQKLHPSKEFTETYLSLFKREKPWAGNCVAIGHAASGIEPLTPAPIIMLQNDIQRILEFLPVSADMTVEQREYNRKFNDNYDHAALFHQAFFDHEMTDQPPYWTKSISRFDNKMLETKISQFESRGLLVQFDHEPFSAEDWTMLHFGMGRIPRRYDPLVNKISDVQIDQKLDQMKKAISVMASKMPPNHIYMSGLLKYLRGKQDVS